MRQITLFCAGRPPCQSDEISAITADRVRAIRMRSGPRAVRALAGAAGGSRPAGGGSGQRPGAPGAPGVAVARAAQHEAVAGGDDGLEVRDVARCGRDRAEGSDGSSPSRPHPVGGDLTGVVEPQDGKGQREPGTGESSGSRVPGNIGHLPKGVRV